jgi:hypothetical protein
MEEKDKARLDNFEKDYPGITSNIRFFDEAELPSCSHCGSSDTANVQVGVIGRTIAIAGMTRKFHLIANGPKPGKYFCRTCRQYFDEENGQKGSPNTGNAVALAEPKEHPADKDDVALEPTTISTPEKESRISKPVDFIRRKGEPNWDTWPETLIQSLIAKGLVARTNVPKPVLTLVPKTTEPEPPGEISFGTFRAVDNEEK